jgi:hypothetical protein
VSAALYKAAAQMPAIDNSTFAVVFSAVWPSVAGLLYWLSRRRATRKKEQLEEVTARTKEFEGLLNVYRREVKELRERVEQQEVWIDQLEQVLRANNLRLPPPDYRRER